MSSVNIINESSLSEALTLTYANVPSSPQVLTLASTQTSILVSWTTPASNNGDVVHGYRIYINDGAGSEPILVHSTEETPSVLSYTLTIDGNREALECSTTYYIEVTAVNLAGESIPAQDSIIVGKAPSAPENLKVTASVPNDKITLVWNEPSDTGCLPIRSYILAIDGTDSSTTITSDMKSIDIDISADGAYGKVLTLNLRATNDKAEGPASNTISITVGSVPNTPSTLAVASRPSNSSLTLSWTADVLITSNQETTAYRIYRINADGSEEMLFTTENSSLNTKATLTRLTTGDTYSLVVRAVNYWGESSNSNNISVVIGTKPSAPPTPTLASSSSTSVTLTISPSSNNGGVPITQYIVSYDVGQTGTFASDTITDLSNLQWQKTGLTTSALVDVKVAATNVIGDSSFSNLVTYVVAGVPAAPAQPSLVGSPAERSDNKIAATISWVAPANQGSSITGYKLYYKKSQSSGSYSIAYSGLGRPDILQVTVTGLTRSTQYTFQVTAINRAGEGTASPTLSFIAAGVPSKPLNLEITDTNTGSITLSWQAPESDGGQSLLGYRASYKAVGAASFTDTSLFQATSTTLSLTADLQYAIRVIAVNSVGDSDPSTSVYGYSSPVPSGLIAPTVVERGETSIKIQWTAPTSSITITGYQVYSNKGDGSYPTELVYNGETIPTRTHATIKELNTGSEYSFAVTAFNGAGMSSFSPILTTLIGRLPDPPAYPPQLVQSTSSSLKISWQASPNSYGVPITAYHVYQDSVKIASVDATVYEYEVTSGLTAGTGYTFAISAETDIGEGLKSHSKTFYAVDIPSVPTLSVTASTRDTCTITWSEVSPPANTVIQGYVLMINDGLESDTYSIAYNGQHNPATFKAVVEGLSARRNYKVKGYAINKAGSGTESSTVTCYTSAPPGQPGRPKLISSTTDSIQVEWEPAFEDGGTTISQYQLYYDEVEGANVANSENWVLAVNSNVLTYNITGLTATKLYRLKVRAKSGNIVAGDYSPIAQLYAASVPDQIAIDTSTIELNGDQITLSWVKPTIDSSTQLDILGYRVYSNEGFRTYDFVLFKDIPNYDLTETTITNLLSGIEYGYKVSAYNAVGEGAKSNTYYTYAMSKPGTPDAPKRVTSTQDSVTEASIQLSWEPVFNTGNVPLTGYKLYQRDTVTDSTTTAYDGSGSATTLTYTVANLVLDRDYEFWVTALNPIESDTSEIITLRAAGFPDAPTSITKVDSSATTLEITWPIVTNDGGSAILAYTLVEEVYYESSGKIIDQVKYFGTDTSALIDGLVSGSTYAFKVK